MFEYCFICALFLSLTALSEGTETAGLPGENKRIQWTMDLQPPSSAAVTVLHPSGDALFSALGTDIIPVGTDLSGRVTNTDNTNTLTRHIEFTLTGITTGDAGDYSTNYGSPGIPRKGVTLVVYAKPDKPNISEDVPPVVGNDMVLTCTAVSGSKPDDNNLQMKYTWFIDDNDLPDEDRYNVSISHLQVKSIQNTDTDKVVTCKAYENLSLQSDVSDGYIIKPKYGPDVVLPNTKESFTLVENEDTLGPISCSANCEPDCVYKWKFNGEDTASQDGVLTIDKINRTSSGTYWCEASNAYGTERSANMTVTVHYGPDAVTLTPGTKSYIPLENSGTLGPINCTADCNPPCSYLWLWDESVVTSTASLTIPGIPRSATGLYTCRANNSIGNGISETIDIDVVYKPEDIMLEPSEQQLVRFENEKLGPINCSAECNPPCQYQWKHNGKNKTQSAVLQKEKVKRDDNGTYVCVAWNEHDDMESKDIYLEVHYGPDNVSLTPNNKSHVLVENIRNTLGPVTCWAHCKPECTYTWTWNNIILDSQSGNLTLDNVKRDKAGTYTCIATNMGRLNKTTYIEVVVQYGPEVVFLSPRDISYTLLEKKTTLPSINCSAACLPPCTYSWSIDGQKINSNLMTQNQTANRTMAGEYECYAENIHNTSSVNIHVTVEYAPDTPKLIKSTQEDIMENKSVSFTCTTDSVPLPEINIMSMEVDGKNDASINSLNNTLTIQQAQCLDTGEYTCDANNKIGSRSSHSVMLNVTCLPRPDHRVAIQKDIYIGNNGSLDITASVIANPAPVLSWTFSVNDTNHTTLNNNSEGFIYYESTEHVTYESHIFKSKLEEGDYGRYTLKAVNNYGNTSMLFRVIAKRSPNPPYEGTVICNSGTAAVVTWKSNFDGGDQQHFLVKAYKEFGKPEIRNQRYEDNGIHFVHDANIENLSPATRYTFIVEAHNDNGESKMREILNCTTKPLDDDDDSGASAAVIGGAAGGSLALIIIIIILGVTLYAKRNRQKKEDDTQLVNMGAGNALQDDPDDGIRQNILYESAGPRRNDVPNESEYAVVDKSRAETSNRSETPADDPTAVYSVVQKQKNVKKGEPKQRGKKQAKNTGNVKGGKKPTKGASRDDVYENVTVNADDVYANVDNNKNQAPTPDKALSRKKNQDGLVYIDVEILNNGRGVKLNGIHGADKRVDYVDIDFTRRADPLPSSSDDDDDDDNDKNDVDKNQ